MYENIAIEAINKIRAIMSTMAKKINQGLIDLLCCAVDNTVVVSVVLDSGVTDSSGLLTTVSPFAIVWVYEVLAALDSFGLFSEAFRPDIS